MDLVSTAEAMRGAVAPFLAQGIQRFSLGTGRRVCRGADRAASACLTKIRSQVDGAKRGVFPWNLESYDDVDVPPADLTCLVVGGVLASRRVSSLIAS